MPPCLTGLFYTVFSTFLFEQNLEGRFWLPFPENARGQAVELMVGVRTCSTGPMEEGPQPIWFKTFECTGKGSAG